VHRVVTGTKERYSVVFFYNPDFDAVIPDTIMHHRIGGKATSAADFNNLLDGTCELSDRTCFGEYIMQKWASVQR
jgi:isopenicillin N synthase-like dioxygenase